MSGRLTVGTLSRVPAFARPEYDPRDLRVGQVHLGAGAFFRAHPAAYTDRVAAGGDHRWGVLATSQRSPAVSDTLAAQDGLYTLLERSAEVDPRARVIGVIRRTGWAAQAPEVVVGALADPEVHVVTLTVTEKGYRIDGAGGLRADGEVLADIAGRPPVTVIGQLVRGIQRRTSADGGPVAIVSCDNLSGNGPLLRRLVSDFVDHLDGSERRPATDWIEQNVTFPSTMVDRIVPATTDQDRAEVARLIGLRDDAAVVAEPFRQWVIEDDFHGPRPAWEAAGAILTDDVAAYERVKLRLLNATHSLIAYLGVLAGHQTIDAALADPLVENAARALIDDQLPTVTAPEGLDLTAYREDVLRRFANPALRHRTTQVAMDGSQKLPQRLLRAVSERRATGACPTTAGLLIAAWMRYLTGRADDGSVLEVSDPLADRLAPLVDQPATAQEITRDIFHVEETFGPELAEDDVMIDCVARWFAALRDRGVRGVLRQDLA